LDIVDIDVHRVEDVAELRAHGNGQHRRLLAPRRAEGVI
jgi:2-phospho-L-lactate guanylyltransferase (CobY/MobA/RfbA family)